VDRWGSLVNLHSNERPLIRARPGTGGGEDVSGTARASRTKSLALIESRFSMMRLVSRPLVGIESTLRSHNPTAWSTRLRS
jgi:hypothetical protein